MQDSTQEQIGILARLEVVRLEQGAWELQSFGPQPIDCPIWGCTEELGELAHTALKFRQGIRGVDATKFLHDGRDAIADICIYLLSFANKGSVNPLHRLSATITDGDWIVSTRALREDFDPSKAVLCPAFSDSLRRLTKAVADLYCVNDIIPPSAVSNDLVRNMLRWLSSLAIVGFNARLENLVEDTWKQAVSKRNWETNPNGKDAPSHSEVVHS